MNDDDPKIGDMKVNVPGGGDTPEEREKIYRDELVAWADLLGQIPGMTRGQIYKAFGKAKQKKKRIWKFVVEPCDCDEDCDCPAPQRKRGPIFHYWTDGVRPHKDIRVLRRRALAEHLRRVPHLRQPYRYAGVELRRPPAVLYMDGV